MSNQNGAVVVHPDFPDEIFGAGCNDFGCQCWSPEQLDDRDWKYNNIGHAERTALFDAATRNPTKGTILVCPWACCGPCGWAIGRMGVKQLIVHKARQLTTPERWLTAVEEGLQIARDWGTEVIEYDGPINLSNDFTIRANGEDWNIHTGQAK